VIQERLSHFHCNAVYTVTINPSEHGTVTMDMSRATFEENEAVWMEVTADDGYEIDSLTYTDANGNKVEISSTAVYYNFTFIMPASNVTVNATFRQTGAVTPGVGYTVTIADGIQNGSVTLDMSGTTFAEGDKILLRVLSDYGYEVDSLTCTDADGNKVEISSTAVYYNFTFIMPASNVTVNATFKQTGAVTPGAGYTVTIADGIQNGTVTVQTGGTAFEANAQIWLEVIAEDGYELDSLTCTGANGQSVAVNGYNSSYCSFMPACSVTVNATFKQTGAVTPGAGYTVTIADGIQNGSVTLNMGGANTFAPSVMVTLEVIADNGYEVDSVSYTDATGRIVTINGSGYYYSFSMPSSNVTVNAAFKETETVEIKVFRNGSEIEDGATVCVGDVLSLSGGSETYWFGYRQENGSQTPLGWGGETLTVTEAMLKYDYIIVEEYRFYLTAGSSPVVYAVTIGQTENGSVTADKATAAENETVTLTVTPGAGYELDQLTAASADTAVDIAHTEDANVFTFTMPDGDVSVTATFKAKAFNITYLGLENGTINGDYPITYTYGVGTTLPADVTRDGFAFLGWYNAQTDGTGPIASIGTEETGDKTFYARWKAIYTVTFNCDGGSTIDPQFVDDGSAATKPVDPVKTGYTFSGWTLDGEAYDFATPVTDNIELKATWTTDTYTISWDTNGDGNVDDTTTVAYGEMPVHADGAKDADAQYTYTFAGWSPEIVAVTGEATYTATFTETVNTYTVKFVNEDGTELQSSEVAYGETPAYTGATPTKAADAQNTYTFAGWTPEIAAVTGNVTYKATFTETANKYTIRFVNEDGNELQSSEVAYGETPAYTGATPTKAADAQYSYTFAGWTPEIVAVTGNVTYKATYTSSTNTYTVVWQNWDGIELEKDEGVAYGTTPSYDGQTPTRAGDTQNTYTFAGWSPEIVAVTGDATYTAQYEAIPVATYTVTFVDWNGTVLKTETVEEGKAATAPADPTREGYTFTSWDKAFDNVTSDLTVTAQYEAIPVATYTVTFVDWDGTVLKTENVEEGKAATAPTAPTREGYIFTGWDKAFGNVTSDLTVTAQYELTPVVDPDPVIISPTKDQIVTVYEGELATMSIVAENAVSYQWMLSDDGGRNWYKRGENSSTYVSSPTKLENDGYIYKCIVTGKNGKTVESHIFTLEVLEKINIPQTGDNSQIGLWMAMCFISMAGILLMRKKPCSR